MRKCFRGSYRRQAELTVLQKERKRAEIGFSVVSTCNIKQQLADMVRLTTLPQNNGCTAELVCDLAEWTQKCIITTFSSTKTTLTMNQLLISHHATPSPWLAPRSFCLSFTPWYFSQDLWATFLWSQWWRARREAVDWWTPLSSTWLWRTWSLCSRYRCGPFLPGRTTTGTLGDLVTLCANWAAT